MSADLIPDLPDDCAEVEALLPLIADGVLDADSDPATFEHLARCERCQRSLQTYDLIDIALSEGKTPENHRIEFGAWANVAWLAAAAGLLGLLLWKVVDQDSPTPAPQVAEQEADAVEIITVDTSGDKPAILIEHQGNVLRVNGIDQSEINPAGTDSVAVPVSVQRR